MSNRGQGSKALIVRLVVVLIIGGGIALFLKMRGTPLTISEPEVARILASRELVGMTLEDAAARLQHRPTQTVNGSVVFDFQHISGWTGQPVVLDLRDGKVIAASWASEHKEVE
jgi:hypothetical protein